MKKYLLLILIFGIQSILVSKIISVELEDNTAFKCEPLFCSDSLLYIWTGFDKFDNDILFKERMHNIHAIHLNEISKIRFSSPKSFTDCAKPAFCTTLVAGGIITAANFREQAASDALIFNGVFNLIFGSGLTIVIHLITHIPNNLDLRSAIDVNDVVRKINKKALLNVKDNREQINRLIKEINPW